MWETTPVPMPPILTGMMAFCFLALPAVAVIPRRRPRLCVAAIVLAAAAAMRIAFVCSLHHGGRWLSP